MGVLGPESESEVGLREADAALRTFREEKTKHEVAGIWIWVLGSRVWVWVCRMKGLGIRVGMFLVSAFGFSGFRVFGFRVSSLMFSVEG